jgi:threonine/homoserine/homoserine lactone efflux protein
LLVGKNAALRGLSSAMTTALGVFTADLVWMTASVIGLTAVLVAFEPAFLAVRLIGSAYLIVLGLRLLFSRDHGPSEDRSSPQRVDSRRAFREGVACDLSNPKTLLVFTSLIPQFLSGSPEPWQLAAYGTAFATMGLPSLAVYAVVFSRTRAITQRPRARASSSRVSGVILIGFGGRLATEPVR